MNLDLLMKFVRLATNNPNEHEANSAARRVCKMIADNGYSLNVTRQAPPNPKVTVVSTPQGAGDWFNEFFKNRPNYETRGTNPRTGQSNPYTEGSWDYGEVPPNPYKQKRPPKSYDNETKPRPEKQLKKCTRCGAENETRNVNNVYICNTCQWTEWQEKP